MPSVKAYLLVPIIGSMFADFLNILTITFFINLFLKSDMEGIYYEKSSFITVETENLYSAEFPSTKKMPKKQPIRTIQKPLHMTTLAVPKIHIKRKNK